MLRRSLLIITADRARGWDLGEQLDADGHDIHLTDDRPGATAKLSTHAIDVVILGELERPADAPGLLRELRAGQLHPRVHPGQPVVTIWGADELSALRAYDAGSDHHLPAAAGYLVVRAVVGVVVRRTFEPIGREQLQVGPLRIDVGAHTVGRIRRTTFIGCADRRGLNVARALQRAPGLHALPGNRRRRTRSMATSS
jgi:DNA-binding response OmpR family regulator